MDEEFQPMKIGSHENRSEPSVASETTSGRGGGIIGLLLLLRHRWSNVRSGVVVVATTTVIVIVILLYPKLSYEITSPIGGGSDSMAGATALTKTESSNAHPKVFDLKEAIHKTYLAALVPDATTVSPLVPLILEAPQFVLSEGGVEFTVLRPKEDAPSHKKPLSSSYDPFASSHLDLALIVGSAELLGDNDGAPRNNEVRGADPSSHIIVLNKYTSFEDHALIVTRSFEAQSALLNRADLKVWFQALAEARAVGFYNSDAAAGASQPHKHMQMISRDALRAMRRPGAKYSFPLDEIIDPFIQPSGGGRRAWSRFDPLAATNRIYSIKSLPFRHSVLPLLPRSNFTGSSTTTAIGSTTTTTTTTTTATATGRHGIDGYNARQSISYEDYLLSAYQYLMRTAQLLRPPISSSYASKEGKESSSQSSSCFLPHPVTPVLAAHPPSPSLNGAGGARSTEGSACVPYNLIVTPSWMFVVPRSNGSALVPGSSRSNGPTTVDINGIGFLGFLLVRDPEVSIDRISPLDLLRRASFPSLPEPQ